MFFRQEDGFNLESFNRELDSQRNELIHLVKQHHGEEIYKKYEKQMQDIIDDLLAANKSLYSQISVMKSGTYETYDVQIPEQADLQARIRSVINLAGGGNNPQARQISEKIEKNFYLAKNYLQDLLPEIVRDRNGLNKRAE